VCFAKFPQKGGMAKHFARCPRISWAWGVKRACPQPYRMHPHETLCLKETDQERQELR